MRSPVNEPALQAALERELHVWIADPEKLPAAELTDRYLSLLDREEIERYRRFHFDRDRLHFLAAHALLRLSLSRYAGCDPQTWRFVRGPYGKPEIDPASGMPPLRFNLSHTQGMVACVVALDSVCGIDVECVRPLDDLPGLARTVLATSEIAALAAQSSSAQQETFFSFWTLKEAYIKATGQGMSAPLKRIAFDLGIEPIGVSFNDEVDGESALWRFQQCKPSPNHRLAVAVKPAAALDAVVYRELDWNGDQYRVTAHQILTS